MAALFLSLQALRHSAAVGMLFNMNLLGGIKDKKTQI
jgi:hypothetical protein